MNRGIWFGLPGIVHLSALHRFGETRPEHTRPATSLSAWQLRLLNPWSAGQSLTGFADEVEMRWMEAVLSLLVCRRINPDSDQHVVLPAHQTGHPSSVPHLPATEEATA